MDKKIIATKKAIDSKIDNSKKTVDNKMGKLLKADKKVDKKLDKAKAMKKGSC